MPQPFAHMYSKGLARELIASYFVCVCNWLSVICLTLPPGSVFISPLHAFTERVTVLGLCVCVCMCVCLLLLFSTTMHNETTNNSDTKSFSTIPGSFKLGEFRKRTRLENDNMKNQEERAKSYAN